jgi:hypothetical protein
MVDLESLRSGIPLWYCTIFLMFMSWYETIVSKLMIMVNKDKSREAGLMMLLLAREAIRGLGHLP